MIKKEIILKRGRINDKLDELLKFHEELMEDLPSEDEFTENRLSRRGIEKTIELIADDILDVALIIISNKGLEKPEDSREAIKVLEKNSILTPELAGKIQDLISFRNLLVHRYGKIDENLEFQNIKENQGDIISFVDKIEVFLEKEEKEKLKKKQK